MACFESGSSSDAEAGQRRPIPVHDICLHSSYLPTRCSGLLFSQTNSISFLLRSQVELHVHVERLHKRPGILEGDRHFHVAEIHAPVALRHVQHLGVGHIASTQAA